MSYSDSQIVSGTTSAVAGIQSTISELVIPAGQQWLLKKMYAAGSNDAQVRLVLSTYPQAFFQYQFNSATAGVIGTSTELTDLSVPINGPSVLSVDVIDQNAASDVEIMIQYDTTGGPTN